MHITTAESWRIWSLIDYCYCLLVCICLCSGTVHIRYQLAVGAKLILNHILKIPAFQSEQINLIEFHTSSYWCPWLFTLVDLGLSAFAFHTIPCHRVKNLATDGLQNMDSDETKNSTLHDKAPILLLYLCHILQMILSKKEPRQSSVSPSKWTALYTVRKTATLHSPKTTVRQGKSQKAES